MAKLGTKTLSLLRKEAEWLGAPLAPTRLIALPPKASDVQQGICSIYNRLGGLMERIAAWDDISLTRIIAIWVANNAWRSQRPFRAHLRVNVHKLFDGWGKRCRSEFDLHFHFGGHNLQPGQPWENQEYCTEERVSFSSVHHNQNSAYEALTVARMLAGDEAAFSSIEIGCPLLPISEHLFAGFETATAMYKVCQESETHQLLAFADYCRSRPLPKAGTLRTCLRTGDWLAFVRNFNPGGEIAKTAARLELVEREAGNALKA